MAEANTMVKSETTAIEIPTSGEYVGFSGLNTLSTKNAKGHG
jgi:hypothetical protein